MSHVAQRSHPLLTRVALISLLLLSLAPGDVSAGMDVERVGDGLCILLPFYALGHTAVVKDREGAKQLSISLGVSAATTLALKLTVDKQRPDGSGDDSFPSGHTAAAFGGAAFLQRRYGWSYGAPAYALASFVGWSRVYADRHRVEDVLAGAAISLASAYYFVSPRDGGVAVDLLHNSYFSGVRVRWTY